MEQDLAFGDVMMGAAGDDCGRCFSELKKGGARRVMLMVEIEKRGEGIATCKKVTTNKNLEIVRLVEESENRKKQEVTREISLPSQSSAGIEIDYSSKKRKPSLLPLARAFDVNTRAQLDEEIARMFYTDDLPFNLARNPHYHRAFTFAATHNILGYVPPGYNKLRTTLLQQEKNNVEKLLQPIKETLQEKMLTIVCDGWSDPTRKHLINFMATYGNGPMFFKAVNCFGEVKDKFFITNLMKEVIDEVGHQNVVQIITDNTANCKGVGEIIESMCPHIYWTLFADTRFASIIVMLKRFKFIKKGLQAMVISDECNSYRENDTVKANFVKEKLVSDDWWNKVAYIIDFTKPIYDILRLSEDSCKVAPHRDGEISREIMKCFRRLFSNDDDYEKVLDEFTCFSLKLMPFEDLMSLTKRSSSQYEDEKTKMWDVGGDAFDSLGDVGYLEFVELSFDEQDLESQLISKDVNNV
ncbi:uncharacterized protein LOC120184396 [Hibiscus syriacus]|uniref:uncharacterized protein LOC120184396 n=1 Tax=Hibiscus syriacus TaxID=106335 RepID=UPI0019229A71|nr:uncharacterized protein LOC120184396 [Hibiscus syriacus]